MAAAPSRQALSGLITQLAMALIPLSALLVSIAFANGQQPPDPIMVALNGRNEERIGQAVKQIRDGLSSNPTATVDLLNRTWVFPLLRAEQYSTVEEFTTAGTIAVCPDTWRIEQLQRHRIEALLAENKPDEALRAAKALFNVCGMGFTKDALPLLVDALKAAHPEKGWVRLLVKVRNDVNQNGLHGLINVLDRSK
jgi:hypothetical protein